MVEIPDYLLERSREARARFQGTDGGASESSSAVVESSVSSEEATPAVAQTSEPEIEIETVPEIIEEVEIVKSKGPRQAQRIKRRKAIRSKVLSDRETKLAGLAALNSDKEIGELPSTKPIPKTAIGVGHEGKFKSIKSKFSNDIGDAARQDSTKKNRSLPATKLGPKSVHDNAKKEHVKVISPLAARGVEVKRNLANRRQASSVPQREIDLDKELESWKKKEEDVE